MEPTSAPRIRMKRTALSHKAVVEALLAHGADVSEKDKNGSTALHWAAMGPVVYQQVDYAFE